LAHSPSIGTNPADAAPTGAGAGEIRRHVLDYGAIALDRVDAIGWQSRIVHQIDSRIVDRAPGARQKPVGDDVIRRDDAERGEALRRDQDML
jgi:hypothetical protein